MASFLQSRCHILTLLVNLLPFKNQFYLILVVTLLTFPIHLAAQLPVNDVTNRVAVRLQAVEKPDGSYSDFIQLPATNLPPYTEFGTSQTEEKQDQRVKVTADAQEEKPNLSLSDGGIAVDDVSVSEQVSDTPAEFIAQAEAQSQKISTALQSRAANPMSRVWLGSVFVVAGLALGFSFGKSGFLLSALGLVFILINTLIL